MILKNIFFCNVCMLLPILKIFSFHMKGKSMHNLWNWLLMFVQCVGCNVNHIDVVQEFDQP
jgi:hypothetical protein